MKGGINILFADGRAEFRDMRWAAETIRRARATQV
jgi:prepilin-type processing-associated H-X9-DG protein